MSNDENQSATRGFFGWLGKWFGIVVAFVLTWLIEKPITSAFRYYKKHKLAFLVHSLLLAVFAAFLVASLQLYEETLDAEITEELVLQIDTALDPQYKRNFRRRQASSNVRELMRVGAPRSYRHFGIRAIVLEARKAGQSNDVIAVLLATAEVESGFNPLAKAKTTTACGLFQFIEETGKRFGLSPNECMDPFKNAAAQTRHYENVMEKRAELVSGFGLQGLESLFTAYYCGHHDGKNASKCSANALRAIRKATPMLHKTFAALESSNVERSLLTGYGLRVVNIFRRWGSNIADAWYAVKSWFDSSAEENPATE